MSCCRNCGKSSRFPSPDGSGTLEGTPVRLNDLEQSMLAGEQGEPRRFAMQHLLEVGRISDAADCVGVTQVHLMADLSYEIFRAFRNPARSSRQTVYIYRLNKSGKTERPYLDKATGYFDSDSELFAYLRDRYGAGIYRILIRDGSTMVYSGQIGIEVPIRR